MKPIVVTLTGPSASGKSVLQKDLMNLGWQRTVSTTSRTRRPGEVNGVHYHFTPFEEFERRLKAGEILEWILRGDVAPAYYGTGFDEIQRAGSGGKPVVMVLDPAGLKTLTEYEDAHHIGVFLSPSKELVLERLTERYRDDRQTPQAEVDERIAMVLNMELNWAEECRSHADLILPAYSRETEEHILKTIVEAVEAIHENVREVEAADCPSFG